MGYETPIELWAFLENSDFKRIVGDKIVRHDEVALIRHDTFLDTDYQILVDIGCIGVRDAARWYVTHTAPNQYDWTWLDRVVAASDKYNLKLYLDLWHYGYPDWLDLMSEDAIEHFTDFAVQIARRYPSLKYWCIANEPSLLVDYGGQQGKWSPFLNNQADALRTQIARMIISASRAVLEFIPDAMLILPEPWHATDKVSEDEQAAILDMVMGLRSPELGGTTELVSVVGLNHYRDSTLPPLHRLFHNARQRWADKPLWFTETSGPPEGWQQNEWFWWMLAETRLANLSGVDIPVFTWAPAISMYDWEDETKHLPNGIWKLTSDGTRIPNDNMIEAIKLAREYGYLK